MLTPVQTQTGFAAGGVQTLSATYDDPTTTGNLLVYVVGGDKDLGTLTLTGWTVPVDLRSSSVSLIIAFKEADGTETTVSGTVTGANSGGSQIWIAEYSQAGSGPWVELATKGENNSDENPVTVWSSGTTGTATGDALAIAAWAVDSVNTAGTPTYDPAGFTEVRTTGNGSGQAGLWVAVEDATASNTYECEIDRVGGDADQMSGAIVVLGRQPAIAPSSVAPTVAFGSAALVYDQTVEPGGIATAEAFGATVVTLAPVLIQGTDEFIPAGVRTIDHELSAQLADEGNLLVYVLAGDKNIGTLTLNGGGWQYPVNLRSTSVSLVIAWKIAAGGEAGITGSFTTGNLSGSIGHLAEYQQVESGYWVVKGNAASNTTEANVTTQTTGTTAASAGNGFAVAGWAVDSFLSDSDDSYSNQFVNVFAQSSGVAEAGLWVARKGVVTGVTYESTLTRSAPVTADQISGGIVLFGTAETQTLTLTGIATAEAFGTGTVRGPLGPTGIATGLAFGTTTVTPGTATVTLTAIASGEAFGAALLTFGFVIQAEGIGTGEAFGTYELTLGVRLIYAGTGQIAAAYLGATPIDGMYVGASRVW